MITLNNRSLDELSIAIGELDVLTSKPGNLSKKEEQRQAALLAKISALKLGVSVTEVRRWEQDRLLQAAGLPALPERAVRGRLDEFTESEWRSFAKGEPIRATSVPPDSEVRANQAGQQSITGTQLTSGGAFVPLGMNTRYFETMKQYDQIFDPQFSNIVETETGSDTAFPAFDDVSNAAVQVGEGGAGTEVDVANVGSKQLNAYTFRSGMVAVSLELFQDSNWPVGSVLERVFAMRFARGIGPKLISGSGVATPTGLITAAIGASAKFVIATGSATNTGGGDSNTTSIGSKDLDAALHALDPAYRVGAVWAMTDTTLSYLEGLLDKQGRPIVNMVRGVTDSEYSQTPILYGKRVAICPSMPNMTAAANPIVLYNPFYFVQRRVPSATYVQRFDQAVNFVEYGLVGFQSFMRVDSNLIAPNSSYVPVVILQQHS